MRELNRMGTQMDVYIYLTGVVVDIFALYLIYFCFNMTFLPHNSTALPASYLLG